MKIVFEIFPLPPLDYNRHAEEVILRFEMIKQFEFESKRKRKDEFSKLTHFMSKIIIIKRKRSEEFVSKRRQMFCFVRIALFHLGRMFSSINWLSHQSSYFLCRRTYNFVWTKSKEYEPQIIHLLTKETWKRTQR